MNTALNLIPTRHRIARRRNAAVQRWVRFGAGYALVMVAVIGWVQWQWSDNPAELKAQLAETSQKTLQTKQLLSQLQSERDATRRRLDANRAVTNQPDYAVLLALLSRALEEGVVLRSCEFEAMELTDPNAVRTVSTADSTPSNPQGFTVRVTGLAEGQRDVSGYVLRLERIGLFETVRLINTRREPVSFGKGSAIGFEIDCFLSTGPADESLQSRTAQAGEGS